MSRVKVAVLLGATAAIMVRSLAAIEPSEDVELRDLKLEAWNCSSKDEGSAQSQEARERNRVKNRWLVNLSGFAVESLDTASFLKKGTSIRFAHSRQTPKRLNRCAARG